MKKNKSQTEYTTLEHVSFTISQINQDILGNQIVNRTYWSTRKKVNTSDKNAHNLMPKDPQVTKENIRSSRKKEQKHVEKLKQLSLFPASKR